LDRLQPIKTKIYIVNRKKEVQSQIRFNIEGKLRDNADFPAQRAFNAYFGNGFSGLIVQEIREFRSLAYSAYGNYNLGKVEGKNNQFVGYLGCQADKTNEAIDAMMGLINNMPEKPERIELVLLSIMEQSLSAKPNFRDLIEQVETWKNQGLKGDPNEIYLAKYDDIEFKDIVNFYTSEIKNKPLAITIVGDVSRFDLEKLKLLGEVVMVKESDLYVN